MSSKSIPRAAGWPADALAGQLGEQLVAERVLPGTPARFADPEPPLDPRLQAALAAQGAARLWSHQVEALAAIRAGSNLLISTATASGKSLVFQIPVLEEALAGRPGRALFLFPLKALGQDQRGKLIELARLAGMDAPESLVEIYDGDTPPAARARIRREPPRVLITNPDMLHLGILAHPENWFRFLGELRWIVLDELHVYRGLFGAHFHHVLARLRRLARAAGGSPSLVAASATAANAAEFAQVLAGEPFVEVAGSGAPREARRLLLARPVASPYTVTLDLLATLIGQGQKTIVFTKARRITELLYGWLRRRDAGLARRVACYRAGFLAEERREIERKLLADELDGVISTSALELGIDIGGLDACILVGFPGSVMATWQRSGRVGRRGRESTTILVALPDALDQYLLDHPDELIARPCEPLVVDPGNEPVARVHLECAAAERPLSRVSDADYLAEHAPVVGELLREGVLAEAVDGGGLVARRRRPQRDVNLRGAGATYLIVDRGRGTTIGTVDGARVFGECHPGAVYLHAGRQYEVAELDLERRRVLAVPADVDFFTSPLSEKETEILELLESRVEGGLDAGLGRLRIRERVIGFERKRTQGQEVIDQQPLDLPPVESECHGLWFRLAGIDADRLTAAGRHLLGSLHAAEHATIGLFPLLALCDRNDLGGISLAFHPQLGGAGVFVYEGHPGGVGIAKRGFHELRSLLAKVRDLVAACGCESGCPSCIQSPKCGNGNRPLDKRGAVDLLELILDQRADRPAPPLPAISALGDATGLEPGGVDFRPVWTAATSESSHRHEKRSVRGGDSSTISVLNDRPAPAEVTDGPAAADDRAQRDTCAEPPKTPLYRARHPDPAVVDRAQRATIGGELDSSTEAGFAAPRAKEAFAERATGGTVLFDIETLRSAEEVGGWDKAHRMGIALAVVCHLEEGRMETFFEPRAGELAAVLKAARLVIGFNSRRFDYSVLSGYTGEDYSRTLPTLDLLDTMVSRLGRRVSLDHLTRETLGAGKSADGLQSLRWVKEGRFDLIEEYCRRDVELLRDLYLFGRREGYVIVSQKSSGRIRVLVDW